MTNRPDVRVRRVYEPPSGEDGRRVLADRLWPRGLSEETAAVALEDLRTRARAGRITLLTAAKDPDRSHTAVLRRLLLA